MILGGGLWYNEFILEICWKDQDLVFLIFQFLKENLVILILVQSLADYNTHDQDGAVVTLIDFSYM